MDITKIGWATRDRKSLRTTIPASITDKHDLKVGDYIMWDSKTEDGKLIIIIKKIEDD